MYHVVQCSYSSLLVRGVWRAQRTQRGLGSARPRTGGALNGFWEMTSPPKVTKGGLIANVCARMRVCVCVRICVCVCMRACVYQDGRGSGRFGSCQIFWRFRRFRRPVSGGSAVQAVQVEYFDRPKNYRVEKPDCSTPRKCIF